MRVLYLVALLSALFIHLSPRTTGAVEQIVASGTSTLQQTGTAGLGSAGWVTVWAADDGGGDINIHARRYASDGTPFGSSFRVNTYTESWQANPAVAALAGGGFVVVWQSSNQDGSQLGIFGQRFATNGTPIGTEFQINTNWSFNQSNAKVAGLSGGGFVVVWQSPMADFFNNWSDEIFARVYNASGEPVTGELQANTVTSGLNTIFGKGDSQMNPAVAATPDGGFIVVWDSYKEYDGSFNISKGISGRRFDAAGTPREQNEFAVNTTTEGAQEMPAVAARQGGGFIVVWHADQSGAGETDVFAQSFDAQGAMAGIEFRVNAFTVDNQMWPKAVLLETGENLIAWYSNWQDGDSGGIYAQLLSPEGSLSGDELRLNTSTAGYQHDHALGVLPAGGWIASWSSSLDSGASHVVAVDRAPGITIAIPATSDTLQVPVTLASSDGIAAWCLSESATPSSCSWSASKPETHVFGGSGPRTLHAFARDSRGNTGTASASTTIAPQTKTLSVSLNGSGSGTVSSDQGPISCPGTCTASYEPGTSVALTPTAADDSLFSGWTGPCALTGDTCRITMDGAKGVTATFTLVPLFKAAINAGTGYFTCAEAYAGSVGNLYSVDGVIAENWTLSGGKGIVWKGGYRKDYGARTGNTVLRGKLAIRSGTLRVDRVKLRS